MTYKPMHEWVKEMGLKGTLAQLADSATDHVGHILDNATPKDVAFMTVWAGLTYVLMTTGAAKDMIKTYDLANRFIQRNVTATDNPATAAFGAGSMATWGLNLGRWLVELMQNPYKQVTGEVLVNPWADVGKATQDPTFMLELIVAAATAYTALTIGPSILSSALSGALI